MDLFELQQRANVLVDKVNNYEASLVGTEASETDLINQSKYVDIFSLRPVMKLLFGKTLDDRLNRTLFNDTDFDMIMSYPPANKVSLNYNTNNVIRDNTSGPTNIAYSIVGTLPAIDNLVTNPNQDNYITFNNLPSITDDKQLVINTEYIIGPKNTSDESILFSTVNSNSYIMRTYDRIGIWTDVETFVDIPLDEDDVLSARYVFSQGKVKCVFKRNNESTEYTLETALDTSTLSEVRLGCRYDSNGSFTGKINLSKTNATFGSSEVINVPTERFVNIDNYNNYNLQTLDVLQNSEINRDVRITQGINYSYSANIYDALVTESQVANIFRWNTLDNTREYRNNSITFNRQVPGIVCYYLGNNYGSTYTATVGFSIDNTENLNSVNYNTPPIYGSMYKNKQYDESQLNQNPGSDTLRMFMTGCSYFKGRLISPVQIFQPPKQIGQANVDLGYNYQGKAIYHELVFKQRRKGCDSLNLDFKSEIETIPDNDPQGLATRVVLSKQKDYYNNRPWFTELDEYYDKDTSILTENIINNSKVEIPGGLTYTKELNAQVDTASNIFYNNKESSTSTENGYIAIPIEFPEKIDSFSIKCKFNANRSVSNFVANTYISLGIDKQGNFAADSSIPNGQNCLYTQIESGGSTQISVYEKRNNGADGTDSTSKSGVLTKNEDNTFKLEYIKSAKTLTLYKDTNNTGVFSEVVKLNLTSELKLDYVKYLFIGCNYHATLNPAITSYQNWQISCYLDTFEFYINGKQIAPAIATTRDMTDEEFYNNYKLDYKTWADSYNKEL